MGWVPSVCFVSPGFIFCIQLRESPVVSSPLLLPLLGVASGFVSALPQQYKTLPVHILVCRREPLPNVTTFSRLTPIGVPFNVQTRFCPLLLGALSIWRFHVRSIKIQGPQTTQGHSKYIYIPCTSTQDEYCSFQRGFFPPATAVSSTSNWYDLK